MNNTSSSLVDTLIKNAMAKHHIPGLSIAIIKNGKPCLLKGYGLANVELCVTATVDTVYEIASITKLFTATAIMMLVEAKRISLVDSITTYLTDLPRAWSTVTIKHILSHQSGLKSYTTVDDYWKTTRLDVPQSQILGLVSECSLDFEPGQKYAYDNTGYYLLGLLIEKVSGESYGDYLENHIFAPLEMGSTQINNPYKVVMNRAAGYSYSPEDNNLKNAEYYSPSGTFSAGVLLSTVADLAKWEATFYTNKLLGEVSRKQMWTAHPSVTANEATYNFVTGLGWFLVTKNNKLFAGHNGSIVGFSSTILHFLANKLTVIMLCNTDALEEPHQIGIEVANYYQ